MELLNLFCLLKIVRNALIALKLRGKPDIPLFAENTVSLIRLPPPPPFSEKNRKDKKLKINLDFCLKSDIIVFNQ